jgi:Skp family chaperone for outer membrane proteins
LSDLNSEPGSSKMSTTLRKAVATGVCITASLLAAYSAAAGEVQTPVVAIIDFQQITRDSKAGAAIRKQIADQYAKYQNEIQRLQGDLEIERQSIQEKQKIISHEKFKKLSKAYRTETEKMQKRVDDRKRHLDQMYTNGMGAIESELIGIIKNIASERGIDLILNAARGQGIVIYANPEIVITSEAQLRLNKRLPEVNLSKPAKLDTGGTDEKAK